MILVRKNGFTGEATLENDEKIFYIEYSLNYEPNPYGNSDFIVESIDIIEITDLEGEYLGIDATSEELDEITVCLEQNA